MPTAIRKEAPEDQGMTREASWSWLMGHAETESRCADLYARMLASLLAHESAMPLRLGMSEEAFAAMLARHFPGVDVAPFATLGEDLDAMRSDEYDELITLYGAHLSDGMAADEAAWAGAVLAAGCMGGDHLWQDMGFWSRADLSAFIGEHFQPLADKNNMDMKWKRFFYKQLCAQDGVYTCRAPSCQVCADYQNCFGPE